MQVPSGAAAETAPDDRGTLDDVRLPSSSAVAHLTSDDMRLLSVQPAPTPQSDEARAPHVPGGLQLPPLLPSDSPVLSTRIRHAEDTLRSLGLSGCPVGGNAPDSGSQSAAAAALAQLQQAVGVACGRHRTASALPDIDPFALLMLALHGGSVARLPPALEAAAAAPVSRFVWPAFSSAMHGAAPLLQLTATTRVLLAREDRAVFTALEAAAATNEVLMLWLQALLVPVLPVPAAGAVAALALAGGPLVLAASAVAVLQELRAGVLHAAGAGERSEVLEWLLAAHCFDADCPLLLSNALAIEARHRHDLLPLLLDPTSAGCQ